MEAIANGDKTEGDSKGKAMMSAKLATKEKKGSTDQPCSQQSSEPNSPIQDWNATTAGSPERCQFRVPFIHNVNWKFLKQYGKKWIKHPPNMALAVWLFCVAVDIVFQGLLMIGLLNHAMPDSKERQMWTETLNQVLNALFTIMCLYQHPHIVHHLIILLRWNPTDIVELRAAYCNTTAKMPFEHLHMAFIIVLLHITCFSQYILCALYWGWSSNTRPSWAENLCIGLGIAAPAIAWLYSIYSPLSKKLTPEEIENRIGQISEEEAQKQEYQSRAKVIIPNPEWSGKLFDCWEDVTVVHLSFFCTFCVFGWNMERLGFGNMYVHIATFILLCTAPLLVFYISTFRIGEEVMDNTLRIGAFLLCFCGLLYGGFWRIRMRKRFNLPPNTLCCSNPELTDCSQWLFCWACSLAQEVRTRNFYGVEADNFYVRRLEEGLQQVIKPWSEGEASHTNRSSFESWATATEEEAHDVEKDLQDVEKGQTMTAPTLETIQIDGNS